jgi:hypothetical protein
MAKRTSTGFNKPKLFSPSLLRRTLEGIGAVFDKTSLDITGSNADSTSSFRYDPVGVGIRSTQQIPVDFSLFQNHTFFNSAVVNVNVAFEKIINEFPFDGTKREIEAFFDGLTGFEKWVFERFPTNIGYLHFNGISFIEVKDYAGYLYPSISKKRTGESVLDPEHKSLSFEMQLYVAGQANDNQIVCQKLSSGEGITLAVSSSADAASCKLVFFASSNELLLTASADIAKAQFNHVVATLDRHPYNNNLQIFINEKFVASSSNFAEFDLIDFKQASLFIGSGSTHTNVFTPREVFSGAIDEFRVFHAARTTKEQELFAKKSIFPTKELKLYFKFNEPTGSIGNDSLVLDSSGNSLHSIISHFSQSLRNTSSIDVPMKYEKSNMHPVLFPSYVDVQTLNDDLLYSASIYDASNPNLITKLVPEHYFQEGQVFEGLQSEDGDIGDQIEGSGAPGTVEFGSAQLLSSFLYVWAKYFDELKMSFDLFGSIIHVDHDKMGYTADQFLRFVAKRFGFDMPAFFTNASIEQFIDAENIDDVISTNAVPLQYVQNQLWRRILTELGEIIRSKGTLHSVKSLFRAMGIEPDTNFRIREFGGPTQRNLENARDFRSDITTLVNFSGTLASQTTKPVLQSGFMSSSRVEPGFPKPKGTFVSTDTHPVNHSDDASDGLWTSGSWTFEATYKFPLLQTGSYPDTQTLAMLFVTGTAYEPTGKSLVASLLLNSGTVNLGYNASYLQLYVDNRSLVIPASSDRAIKLLDGNAWNIQFGRQCSEELDSFGSSSYFLRAARQDFGDVKERYSASYAISESNGVFSTWSTTNNASGAFFVIGSQSIDQTYCYLNSADYLATHTEFMGQVGQIRFWSKALSEEEWIEHVKNFRSVGVSNPAINFNFNTTSSGSFERLRIDASAEQQLTESNASGEIQLFDFSQNKMHLTGTGFEAEASVFAPHRMFFSQLSPRFDEASANNKVRVRSFEDYKNVQLLGGVIAPLYEIPPADVSNDDTRFCIDFSIMDALDEDIVRIFATFDSLDNAIGNPELLFSPDYPSLEDLRDVYFNRLTSKVKLKQFFEFFKWFDAVLGISTFIEQLLPRKTNFLGTNFVIESHMLERPKVEYLSTDIYIGENNRHGLKGQILLQQFVGVLRKY